MAVLVDEDGLTRLSFIEYQATLLLVALLMCAGWAVIELTMNRFQVLTIVFPGMFSVRGRRFFFFDFDVSDKTVGKRLREDAKMILRVTTIMVLAYLWQHCVLETTQIVGTTFPHLQCEQGQDCFASELHIATLINRKRTPVNCSGSQEDFPMRVVVSCIRIIPPNADQWLMHLAIAHAVSQLCIRCYEVLVWSCGRSPRVRYFIGLLVFVSASAFCVLFYGGLMLEFAASWLMFVTGFSVPILLATAWRTGKEFEFLWTEQTASMQKSIEEHLEMALSEFRVQAAEEEEEKQWEQDQQAQQAQQPISRTNSMRVVLRSSMAEGARRARGLLSFGRLTSLLGRRPSLTGIDPRGDAELADLVPMVGIVSV